MNLDRDLRDALQPMTGDPVADARRVLGALPGGTGGPAKTPKGLPVGAILAGVLALGVVIGLAVSNALGGGPEPVEQPVDPPPKEKEDDKPKDPQPRITEVERLLLMAFGEVTVKEPKQAEKEVLSADQWTVELGTSFETGQRSTAGIFAYASNVAVRLGRETVATVHPDCLNLREGRLWFRHLGEPSQMLVETDRANLLTEWAELMVERSMSGLTVTVLDGSVTVRSDGGGSRRIEAMHQITVDSMGILGDVEALSFAGTVTSWMTKMIVNQSDQTELRDRVGYLIEAYVDGAHRDAAATELRRLGSAAVSRLYSTYDAIVDDPDFAHRTAGLIGDLAQPDQWEWVMALLERGDEETRAIAYHALRRVTGTNEEDETFWRANTEQNRASVAWKWRERLK